MKYAVDVSYYFEFDTDEVDSCQGPPTTKQIMQTVERLKPQITVVPIERNPNPGIVGGSMIAELLGYIEEE